MATGLHAAGGLPAHRVGSFILRRWLAQGGMAELYLATPADPARASQVVVVKRVLPQFSQDPQFARMFAREAQLASALKHPNIVEVFESHAEGADECFFAMEYVHGPDLAEVLRRLKEAGTAVPLCHALTLAAGICAGLEHAHEHRDESGQLLGIVHRDVSPSNVMIAHDGTIKIMDFGVAKALALTSFTQAGTRKGKLSYMSPEQAVADPVDRRTDVFAIGAVLFELTTMQRMLGGDNELAVMHKLLFRERPRPSEIKPGYPPDLERVVLQAVAQSPTDRFQTAGAMQQAIEEFARRNNIRLSATALAQWVASVIPPKPHPASDPDFFVTPAPQAMPSAFSSRPSRAEGRETTMAEGGPHTLAGRGAREDPTALDGPQLAAAAFAQGPATTVGHLMASEDSNVAHYVPLAPSGAVIVNPEAIPLSPMSPAAVPARPVGTVSAVPRMRTSAPASRSGVHGKARSSSNAGVGVIIGVAGLIAASVVLSAIWYTRSGGSAERDPPAPTQPAVEVGVPPSEQPAPVEPEGSTPTPVEPNPLPGPVPVGPEGPANVPTPIAPEIAPIDPAVESPVIDPPTTDAPTPTPQEPPSAGKKKRDKDKDRDKDRVKKRPEDKPPPESKGTQPVPDKKPPPPPPPPRKKAKPPTDTLLPIGG
jgi:serine/threonine-protein kinase